jgi:hypothetical protein
VEIHKNLKIDFIHHHRTFSHCVWESKNLQLRLPSWLICLTTKTLKNTDFFLYWSTSLI